MSNSLKNFQVSLKHTDNLMAGTKTGPGKPSNQEASMFVASVALTYAAWEAYVEDVAIEATEFLAGAVAEDRVPESARRAIEGEKPSAWQLTVHPGWRTLWVQGVRALAKGDADAGRFGMNTARVRQITTLFLPVGLDFIGAIEKTDRSALEKLVTARGSVVHSASTPSSFNKAAAKGYRDLVTRMADAADEHIRAQVEELTTKSPWPKV
ncbi:hypothetical protein [Curtobacterium flaccumfaciens]|uniref:hypothetical protein n=1 Tax=Curtobacterium flaccumfaciens TaxID=2035 RepID=UPI0026598F11|nr:hypothetical protein [Curtobacterium flaccumfaciens]MCS5507134.1 hypothetical protein [Curtobacterium flaccumfaciens pv. flaccumfaciens]